MERLFWVQGFGVLVQGLAFDVRFLGVGVSVLVLGTRLMDTAFNDVMYPVRRNWGHPGLCPSTM